MPESEKWKWSRSVVSNPQRPHGLQPSRLLRPWEFPGKSTGGGCHCLLWLHAYDSFILQLEVSTSLFPSPNPFFPQPPHLWRLSVLCIYDSVSALLCLFIYSSDFTYRWSLAVFVFLWLISLNRTPLRSIHVVANGSISFFLWWTVFRGVCVCVYTPHLL